MIPYATRRVTSPSPVDATQELWGRGRLLRGDLSDEMRRMEPLDTGAFGVGLPYGLGALNWLAARLRRSCGEIMRLPGNVCRHDGPGLAARVAEHTAVRHLLRPRGGHV